LLHIDSRNELIPVRSLWLRTDSDESLLTFGQDDRETSATLCPQPTSSIASRLNRKACIHAALLQHNSNQLARVAADAYGALCALTITAWRLYTPFAVLVSQNWLRLLGDQDGSASSSMRKVLFVQLALQTSKRFNYL
jgi:hypothetical protein